MDRFTRFKLLRALWARAKNLLAWLYGPRAREERLRAQTWQQINVTERHIRDGMIRGTGDPDSAVRPQASDPSTDAVRASQAHAHHAWQAQVEAQRAWYLAAQRAEQQRRHNGKR
jgi:hypothetical protein